MAESPARDLVTPSAPAPDPAPRRGAPPVVVAAPLALLALLLVVLVKVGASPVSDPDTLWHVVAGHELWSTWQFAGPDPLSRFAPLPFVRHQWLPELVMAGADAVAGLPGVAWLFTLMLVGFVIAVYAACRSTAGVLAGVLATVGGLVGAGGSLTPRPQVVGLVLLAVTLGAWLRTEGDGRLRWWLLPLTWLWACVHGTWVYAVALAAIFGVGMLLDRRLDHRTARRIGLGVLGMVLLAMATPVGPRLLLVPSAVQQVSASINEWRPVPVTDPRLAVTLTMGVVVVVTWVGRGDRPGWTRILLWLFAMGSALVYARTIAVGAVLLAPLFADTVQRALPERTVPPGWERATVVGAATLSLLLAALVVPTGARAPGDVPSSFDPVLASLPTGTVVWNVDALGGWLLYAHPNVAPTMDTRAEVYGPDYQRAYVRAVSGAPGWQDTVTRTQAAYAIVAVDGALAGGLQHERGWRVVATQAPYVLLASP